nr:TolC family protein [Schwartzia sp. (in: firmicutes)]
MKKTGRFKKGAALAAAMLFYGAATASAADLTIQQAVDMALEQNISLKITEKGEDTAKANLKSARGTNSFSVSAGASLTDTKTNDVEAIRNGSTSLSVSLPLYSGGKNQAGIKSAEVGMDAARLQTLRERENLRLKVIKAYYDVLESKRVVEIDQESVDRYEAHLTNMEQLYSAGSKARLDVLRSSVELTNARQTLIKAKNSYEVNVVTLKNLLRMDQSEPLNLTEDFRFMPFFPKMDACVSYAYANRKDLIVDTYKLKQQELAVTMAKAGYLPTLTLNAGVSGDHRFTQGHGNDHSRTIGLRANWNIFDSGVTEAAVDKAKTNYEIAELQVKKDKEDIDLNVRQQYYNMREAQRRLIATQSAVK